MKDLPESELRKGINGLLDMGPRRGARELAGNIADYTGHDIEVIVESLCMHNSVWIGEFRKLLIGKRRPPSQLRPHIVAAIQRSKATDREKDVKLLDVLKRRRTAVAAAMLTIESPDELSKAQARRKLFAKLAEIQQAGTPVDLEIRIECDNANPHGLAFIAAWCERFAARVEIDARHVRVSDYLQRTGIRDILEERISINAPLYDERNHVAITRIDRDERTRPETDLTAGRIVSLFVRHMNITSSQRRSLGITFSELIENVYRHAQSNFPGIVMAQAYPRYNRLQIEIIDTGIGIFDSFRKSKGGQYRDKAVDDVSSIGLAVQMFVTSKQERHQGYGLYIVKRLVEKNKAKMMVTSGKGTSYFVPAKVFTARERRDQKNDRHQRWPGTGISLDFDLSQSLEILDVYNEMPSVDDEDFFS